MNTLTLVPKPIDRDVCDTLCNFAGILTAFIQSVKDEEFYSHPNKDIYSKELSDLIITMQDLCSDPENRSYLIDHAIPEMCIGYNITEGDVFFAKVISKLLTMPKPEMLSSSKE